MLGWFRRDPTDINITPSEAAAINLDQDDTPTTRDAQTERSAATGTRSYGLLALFLFIGYMALAAGLYVWRGAYFTPDRWAILLFLAAIALGQWKAFLRDWIPVVFLIFGYEFIHGLAYQDFISQGRTVHVTPLIDADRFMFFGHLPTLWLQHKLYVEGTIHWYDALAMVMYVMHFVFPLIFAFILWVGSKERYWYFTLTFLLMTYLGFAGYLLYPAAPPWLASNWGFIHGVQLPFDQVYHALVPHQYDNLGQVQIWDLAGGDPVAAMPSLHAAYPWMTLLFAVKFFRKWGLLLVPYNVALWFSVVYLGEHYVIDIVAGMALSTVVFVVMLFVWPRLQQSSRLHRLPGQVSVRWRRTFDRLRPLAERR